MTQPSDVQGDGILMPGEWDWAFRLLRELLDDEPTAGLEPTAEEEEAARAAAAAQPAPAAPNDGTAGTTAPEVAPETAGRGGDSGVGEAADPADDGFYFGGSASERLTGSVGDDLIDGMGGDDSLAGAGGDDLIDGGDGLDLLFGGQGDDILIGGSGNDTVDGGQGDDDLGGDAGDDRLTGGRGSDIFSFDLQVDGGAGVDTLVDFRCGEDLIWIIGDNARWSALDSNGDGLLGVGDRAVSVDTQGMRIGLDGLQAGLSGSVLVLKGVGGLDAGDMILVEV